MKKSLLFVLLVVPTLAEAGLFGPSNYNECILDKMKGVNDDLAAALIARACAEEFAPPSPYGPKVPSIIASKLTGKAGLNGDLFNGFISNSSSYKIDEVGIEITPQYPKNFFLHWIPTTYDVPIDLPPGGTAQFSLKTTDKNAVNYTWRILWARSK